MGKPRDGLTLKQARFVDAYVETGNGSEAARRAGYSPDSARAIATENLTKPLVSQAIGRKLSQIQAESDVTPLKVLQGIGELIEQAREENQLGVAMKGHELLGRYCRMWDVDPHTLREGIQVIIKRSGGIKTPIDGQSERVSKDEA